MEIEALLFDLGRVIVDFDMAACESALASRSGLDREDFLSVLWDSGSIRRYERGELSTEEFYQFLSRNGALKLGYEEFRQVWSDVFDPIPVLPSALLSGLARRYTMALISNTNEAHADHIRRNYDVFGCFTHHILSYEVGVLKPDPKIFEEAIGLTGHPPEEVLFIDDREENVVAGAALGLQVHRFSSYSELGRVFEELGVETERSSEDSGENVNGVP